MSVTVTFSCADAPFIVVADGSPSVDKVLAKNEAYSITKNTLWKVLSKFERVVLEEYLSGASYRDVAKLISCRLQKRHNTKSIDNALLRIRKKAVHLRGHGKNDDIPLFTHN